MTTNPSHNSSASDPTPQQIKQWKQYLADEKAEAQTYRALAQKKSGEEQKILLSLAEAEGRHAQHWEELLKSEATQEVSPSLRNKILTNLTRRFGSVFVLALAQQAEARTPYNNDEDATDQMAADEKVHGEVIRALATEGRNKLSGSLRAAVFGANDGLVSNLALIIGMGATNVTPNIILFTGIAGLLAGALSMAAGEYISVKSQQELVDASNPDENADKIIPHLDESENELELVFRARGMSTEDAQKTSREIFERLPETAGEGTFKQTAEHAANLPSLEDEDLLGSPMKAAVSSFLFFASGAFLPIIPYLFGMSGPAAMITAAVLVGIALLFTGSIVGILSGKSPLSRAIRQLLIGYGAAAVTYCLGLIFGSVVG